MKSRCPENKAAIQDEAERLQLAFKATSDGLWDWNIVTGTVYYSDQFKILLGYESSELSETFVEFRSRIHPDDLDTVMEALQQHRDHHGVFSQEYRLRTKQGVYNWYLARGDSQRDFSGNAVRMVCIVKDITSRKIQEFQLSHEQIQLKSFVENAPAAVAMFDAEMRYLTVSNRWLLDHGMNRTDIIGWSYYEIFPDASETWKEVHKQCLAGESYRCESDHWRPPGKDHDQQLCWEANPWRKIDGSIGGIIIFARDITASADIVRELEFARIKALEASQLKSEFLANTSHEIRTPMNGIIGMTQLLLDTNLDPDQRSLLSDIDYSAKSLMAIINDILDLSKIESGKLELSPVAFDLDELIGRLLNVLKPKADEQGTCVVYEPDETLPRIFVGDECRLRQVLINLVGNAIKFTREDGGLIITSYGRRQSDNSFELQFSIADTGIGIESNKIDSIFDPFTQADGATTRKYGGTGLGLTICRRLVELMGGSIWVESIPNVGSAFHFTVKLGVAAEQTLKKDAPRVKTASAKSLSKDRPRVLVVEDNVVNQKLIMRVLEHMGCDVALANDGKAAIDRLLSDSQRFSLIFMDCQMPVMNGYDATREIRNIEKYTGEHVVIVAMTANAMEGDDQLCIDAGMDDYLSKPIDRKQLQGLLSYYTISASEKQNSQL